MRLLDWVAAIVLLCQLPIPLFWLIVHPLVGFWRRHIGVAYLVAVLSAWGGVAVFVYLFHERLLTKGVYARVRHPRYSGMMFSVLGACLIAGTLLLWEIVAVWWLLALVAIRLEEKELHARFGAAYAAYSKRVPRFLPFRAWPRNH